ncbi:hypothetical protein HZA97_00350 [Candidatus Woesearchaeota archaeon]|nr:hypothetical protein [Candidatus Woesearchaeota archaeon]
MNSIKNYFRGVSLTVLLSAGLSGCATLPKTIPPKAELWGVYEEGTKKEERLYRFYDEDNNGKCETVNVYRNAGIFSKKDHMPMNMTYDSTLYGEGVVEELYNKLTKQEIERVNRE